MCKKGAQIFQRIHPKVDGSGSPSVSLNDEERNNNNDSRHITSVLLWKMVGYTPSSFADLVFAGEMIEVGLKRGKSDNHALIKKKLGQMKRVRVKEKPMLRLPFLYSQVSHQPNNVITQPITTLLLTHHPIIHKGHP